MTGAQKVPIILEQEIITTSKSLSNKENNKHKINKKENNEYNNTNKEENNLNELNNKDDIKNEQIVNKKNLLVNLTNIPKKV